eukprot:gene8667-10260_t
MFGDLVLVSDSGQEIVQRLQSMDTERSSKHRLAGLRKVLRASEVAEVAVSDFVDQEAWVAGAPVLLHQDLCYFEIKKIKPRSGIFAFELMNAMKFSDWVNAMEADTALDVGEQGQALDCFNYCLGAFSVGLSAHEVSPCVDDLLIDTGQSMDALYEKADAMGVHIPAWLGKPAWRLQKLADAFGAAGEGEALHGSLDKFGWHLVSEIHDGDFASIWAENTVPVDELGGAAGLKFHVVEGPGLPVELLVRFETEGGQLLAELKFETNSNQQWVVPDGAAHVRLACQIALKNNNEENDLLTHDDVVLAYRLMLGRDPENADVVNNLCQTVHTVAKLREVFIGSAEFQQRMGELLGSQQFVRQRHPFTMPSIPVEVGVSREALAQMFERIHQAWEYLGETDPYWSVVTQPQYHMDQFDSHKDQFFKSGKYSADLFFAALRRNHVNPNLIGLCLEVGCGVGRVTNYLAQTVERVLGADISAHHLEIARDHLAKEGRSNVTLKQLTDIRSLNDLPPVDAIFSVITLQHNPPPVIAWMLRTLLGCLKPSGVAYLQIPTYRNGYLFEADRYLNTPPTKSLEMHFLPQHEIFKIVDEAGCRCLEIREDSMVGEESKMLSNTFVFQKSA